MILSFVLFPLLIGAEKAHALPYYYTLSEYNAAVATAGSAVDSATAEVASAQAAVDASAVYHETSTVTGQVNVVVNGTFDDASAWSSIGMGDGNTILNSSIARVYNGVLIGSYNYGDFILQTGTFPSPTRQVTFRYEMSNNNFNDGQRLQADMYRVEFRTYSANATRLNYYDTRNRNDTFGWTTFTNTYNLSEDAVRWDIGFRLADSGYWNGNFAGSIDNVSLVTNATIVTPAYTTYNQDLVNILNEKKAILRAAQDALTAIPTMVINAPTNLTASVESGTVTLDWDAPASGLIPERYAISWTIPGNAGWGIATGNAGDANALNTSITIDKQIFSTSGGWDKDYTFYIRSDQDTASMYSANSNQVTIYLADPTPTPTPESSTVMLPPTIIDTSTSTPITTPTTGPTAEEIAASVAAQALAQQLEAARIQAETAALIARQAEAAQAEAERIAALIAAQEAAIIQAEIQAKVESDRIEAEIEAARIQAEIEAQEEADRIAAEVKAAEEKAEAEAKAEADRIAAEEEADRIRAEEEAIRAEEKAKAEEEAIAEEIRQAEEDAKAEAEAKELEEAQNKEDALEDIIDKAKDGEELTEEQTELVVDSLLEDLKEGEALSASDIQASGISYSDLPPQTPVDVRTDENGNAVVITAEVAAQVELLENPSELFATALSDPGAALAALGAIGADMSEEEREEATDMVVATVVAAGAAINAAAVAAGGSTGGSSSGGGGSGGGSGSNSPGSRGGRRW